jgi:hypothetical protein
MAQNLRRQNSIGRKPLEKSNHGTAPFPPQILGGFQDPVVAHRLGNVGIGPGFPAPLDIFIQVRSGPYNNWDFLKIRIGFDFLQGLSAVFPGHIEIQKDDRGKGGTRRIGIMASAMEIGHQIFPVLHKKQLHG